MVRGKDKIGVEVHVDTKKAKKGLNKFENDAVVSLKDIENQSTKLSKSFESTFGLDTNTKTKNFTGTIKNLSSSFSALAGPIGLTTAGLTAYFSIVGKATSSTLEFSKSVADEAQIMGTLSNSTKVSTQTISQLAESMVRGGKEIEDVSDLVYDFTERLGDARTGNKTFSESFKALGVDINQSADKALRQTIQSLQDMDDKQQSLFRGIELFSENYKGLVKDIQEGNDILGNEGLFSDVTIKNSQEFTEELRKLQIEFKKLSSNSIQPVIGSLADLMSAFNKSDIEKTAFGRSVDNVFGYLSNGIDFYTQALGGAQEAQKSFYEEALESGSNALDAVTNSTKGLIDVLDEIDAKYIKTSNAAQILRSKQTPLTEEEQRRLNQLNEYARAQQELLKIGQQRLRNLRDQNSSLEDQEQTVNSIVQTVQDLGDPFLAWSRSIRNDLIGGIRESELELTRFVNISEKARIELARISAARGLTATYTPEPYTETIDPESGLSSPVVARGRYLKMDLTPDEKADAQLADIEASYKAITEEIESQYFTNLLNLTQLKEANAITDQQYETRKKELEVQKELTKETLRANKEAENAVTNYQRETDRYSEEATLFLKEASVMESLRSFKGTYDAEVDSLIDNARVKSLNFQKELENLYASGAINISEFFSLTEEAEEAIFSGLSLDFFQHKMDKYEDIAGIATSTYEHYSEMAHSFTDLVIAQDQRELDSWKAKEQDKLNSLVVTGRRRSQLEEKYQKEAIKREEEISKKKRGIQIADTWVSALGSIPGIWGGYAQAFAPFGPAAPGLINQFAGFTTSMVLGSAAAQTAAMAAYANGGIPMATGSDGGMIGGYQNSSMGSDTQVAMVRSGEPILTAEMGRELLSYARGEREGGAGISVQIENFSGNDEDLERLENTLLKLQQQGRTNMDIVG